VPKIDVKKSFGASVKGWRQQLGYSQEELAERAELHRTYISDVERGARNVSLESINKLARALDVSVSTLFSVEPQQKGKNAGNGNHGQDRKLVDILLVEDEMDDVELALEAFKKARFANRVHVVGDGEEALNYLFCRGKYTGRGASENLQMVLLDLKLPKVSGLEVLRIIKTDKRTAGVPVVVLTVSDDDYDITECRRLGADNYIVKPLNFQRLSRSTPSLNLEWGLFKQAKANT
jgi:CheY-like chemotaxis protein/DNA-binding Xre family transcriptional regulator